MSEDYGICEGCGTPRVLAPGIGTYCPNRTCDYELCLMRRQMAEMREREERQEYERLKAKYGEGT